jgi:putative acetyltransferase
MSSIMIEHAIEHATVGTVAECATVLRTTRKHSLPYLRDLHTADEDLRFLVDRVFTVDKVLVALDEARRVVGFIAFSGGWINHLYVLPGFQRVGIGGRLLEEAKRRV